MNIQELEEQLRGILQRTEEIKKQIEALKNQDKPVTFIPMAGQNYFYPHCDTLSGIYAPSVCYYMGKGKYQADAFETEEQCQKACDILNKIMPALKYAIENPVSVIMPLVYHSENKMTFEIFFDSSDKYAAARKFLGEPNE